MVILKHANILHFYPPEVILNQDIVINGSKIVAVGEELDHQYKAEKVLDLNGKYVSPGLVCAHNHFYSALARGILTDIPPSPDFVSILKNLWWRLDRALDEHTLYYSGIIGALEAIKAGTTTVIDHHASPKFIKGSLETLKRCFEQVGLRGILSYEVTDRNGEKGMREGLEESLRFVELLDGEKEKIAYSLIETAIGAHAPFTLSDKTLSGLSDAVFDSGRGIHIHTAEDAFDPSFSHHFHGLDIMKRLATFDLLNEKSLFVHGVHFSEDDIDLLNAHHAFLIHNPRSNMNNGVGYMSKLHQVKKAALGTDGIGANMLEELKVAFFKNSDAGGLLDLNAFLKMLQNGNQLLERYFQTGFGRIEPDYIADLVIFDYQPPTPLTGENLAGHLIYGFASRDVETVIVNGKVVYEDRQFPFDVESIYYKAQQAAKKLWKRMNSVRP